MDATTIVFVAAGIVLVLVVGQLLRRTGRRYVGGAGGAGSDVGTVATLLSTVFHLVTLGITALVAAVPVGEGVSGFLVRFGILLLVVGVVFGVFVGILARRREVAITEAAAVEEHPGQEGNPNVPGHAPSYLPPSGLPGDGTGTRDDR